MKILVTGGAGYLGSILVGHLLDTIAPLTHVTVLDSFVHRENTLAHLCSDPQLQIIHGDVRDPRVLTPLVKAHDCIIPLAALVGAPLCAADPTAAHDVNCRAVEKICAYTSAQQMIVIPTTNSGYGIGAPGVLCTEESPLRPLSVYGRTKVNAEQYVLESGGVSLRLATVFGASPRMRLDLLVNEFVWRACKDRSIVLFEGHFKRNFIHVRDVARAFVHAIDNYGMMQENAFNVGLSTANLSKIELCEAIKRHIPEFSVLEAPVGEDPDKRDYTISNEKFEKTGWKPQYSIDDGIVELMKLYQGLRNGRYSNV